MRVLLIAVGSRGDAEPFCSLAASLAASDQVDTVDLFLQKDLKNLVPSKGADYCKKINYHELPFTQMDFYKYAGERKPPQAGADHENPRVRFLGIVTDIMGEMVLPCYENVMKVAAPKHGDKRPADAIVASSLARQLAMEIAAQIQSPKTVPIPLYLVQLQSLVPTNDFPHYSQHKECLDALTEKKPCEASEYRDSHIELERFQYDFLKEHMTNKKDSILVPFGYEEERSSFSFEQDMLPALTGHGMGNNQNVDVWMVNAVSTHLIPSPSDAGPKVLNVGALADAYIPADFEPHMDLVSFLETHKSSIGGDGDVDSSSMNTRPICFGYGSMPFGNVQGIMDALYECQRPAVLVGSAMVSVRDKILQETKDSSLAEWIQENVFCVEGVPYAWLLPRCSMMFSHGGAGVVHATLRAGIPAVISPLMGDQFFFAEYLEAKGLGVQASSNMQALSKECILQSIDKAEKCQSACRQFGSELAKVESGPDLLASAITERVSTSSV